MNGYTVFIDTDKRHGGELYLHSAAAAQALPETLRSHDRRVQLPKSVIYQQRPSEAATVKRIRRLGSGPLCMARAVTWSTVGWIGKVAISAPNPVKRKRRRPGDAGH